MCDGDVVCVCVVGVDGGGVVWRCGDVVDVDDDV